MHQPVSMVLPPSGDAGASTSRLYAALNLGHFGVKRCLRCSQLLTRLWRRKNNLPHELGSDPQAWGVLSSSTFKNRGCVAVTV